MTSELPPSENARNRLMHTFFVIAAPPEAMPRERMNAVLCHVLDFWLSVATETPPARAMVDPVRLRRVLPHLMLWDVLPERAGYRCRLAGTEVCAMADRELRGLSLEEVHGIGSDILRAEFDSVRDGGNAHYAERTMHWVVRSHRLYKRLLLPLVDGNGDVDTLLGVMILESDA